MTDNKLHFFKSKLGKEVFDFDEYLQLLSQIKKIAVFSQDQESAKQIWIRETITNIHKCYCRAFHLLQNRDYYEGWCQLERVEIEFGFLRRHFVYDDNPFNLKFIEKATRNLQVLFPYKLFGSSEILKIKKQCSICAKEISIRNPCGHVIGEIYDGEMCQRIVTEAKLLAVSIVENPGNKYSVLFLDANKEQGKKDPYHYETIDYLLSLVNSPYEYWDLELQERFFPKSDYENLTKKDSCPCGSGKDYGDCCHSQEGVRGFHYNFMISEGTRDRFVNENK